MTRKMTFKDFQKSKSEHNGTKALIESDKSQKKQQNQTNQQSQ